MPLAKEIRRLIDLIRNEQDRKQWHRVMDEIVARKQWHNFKWIMAEVERVLNKQH
jgi:hypothetical protein